MEIRSKNLRHFYLFGAMLFLGAYIFLRYRYFHEKEVSILFSVIAVFSVISVIFFAIRFGLAGGVLAASGYVITYYVFLSSDEIDFEFIPVSRIFYNFALIGIGVLVGYISQINRKLDISLKHENKLTRELLDKTQGLEKLSITDHLTGIFNRRYFYNMAAKLFSSSERYNQVFSIVIIDLDHFKNINDEFGHLVGDKVLVRIARFFDENLRKSDILARFGGEEFILFLPSTNLNDGLTFVERIRNKLSTLAIELDDYSIQITASFGITGFSKDDKDINDAIDRADKALYKAKANGRNRVEINEPLK